MIPFIKSLGFRVFVQGLNPAYCIYTDGKNIGYAQWGFRRAVSTVRVPNHQNGTGFAYADEINAETLKGAMLCFAPSWASNHDRQSVQKYQDIDAYLKASKFNSGYTEV